MGQTHRADLFVLKVRVQDRFNNANLAGHLSHSQTRSAAQQSSLGSF
jgi:hypothetical protein